jgi:hypothetical protein
MSDAVRTAGNMPVDVIPVWDHVWGTVAELDRYWRFHVGLYGSEKYVSLLQEILLGPMLLIRKAVLSHITMGIGRLLDHANHGKRANLSFAHLLDTVRPHVTPEFSARLAVMLDQADNDCKPLLLWRDKRFGHADKDHVLGVEQLPEVAQESFEKALTVLRDLLAEIHAYFNGPGLMHFPAAGRDADDLIRYIQQGHDAERAEIARLFS